MCNHKGLRRDIVSNTGSITDVLSCILCGGKEESISNDELVAALRAAELRAAEKEANIVRFCRRSIAKLLALVHSALGSSAIHHLLYCNPTAALLQI